MLKKVLIGIGTILALIITVLIIVVIVDVAKFNVELKANGLVGFGKEFTVEITEDYDYTIFEDTGKFDIWTEKERNKMMKYMKKNNLKLKPGTYTINSANTFEKALEIFILE
jgi:cell division protein YceG involved in septum cleavage